MMFAVDLWHKSWGFGFTIVLWHHIDEEMFVKFEFHWQVKLFGRKWGTGE